MKRLWLLLAVLLAAALFRLPALDRVPPGLFIDEALNGIAAEAIARGESHPVFIEPVKQVNGRNREPLYHYLMAGLFAVFGPGIVSLRLTSALLGVGTVIAYFILLNRLFDPRTAGIASFLLAASRWHVTFSRIGFRAILAPLWIVLTLLACERFLRTRTLRSAASLGLVLGLGLYTYPSYWVVPLPVFVVLLAAARRQPRRTMTGIVAVACFMLLAATPLMFYAAGHPDEYFARAREAAEIGNVRANALKVLLMLHVRGDTIARHNIPGHALLDPITGLAFLVGLLALAKSRQHARWTKAAILACWLLPLLPSVVSAAAPHAMRTVGAAPAVCLIAAMGITAMANGVERLSAPNYRHAGTVLVFALLTGAAAWNAHDYFQLWGADPRVAAGFSADMPRFHAYLRKAAKGDEIYASPYIYWSPNIRFLNLAHRQTMHLIEDEAAFLTQPNDRGDRVFVSASPAVNFLLERYFPRAEVLLRYSVQGSSQGRVVRVRNRALKRTLNAAQRSQIRHLLRIAASAFRAQIKQL